MAVALGGAAKGELGAGDLVWARDTSRLDCAVVLEPEVERDACPEMLFLTMVALGDAIGALAPPEVAVRYRWPQVVTVNGAVAGRAFLVMSDETHDDGAPRFLVAGAEIAIRHERDVADPGNAPDKTTLFEEGCAEMDRTALIESFSRHFLAWIDTWEADGFGPIHDMWLGRAEPGGPDEEMTVAIGSGPIRGRFVGLDDHGNLLLRRDDGIAVVDTMDALAGVPPDGTGSR